MPREKNDQTDLYRDIIPYLMRKIGKDPLMCEQCEKIGKTVIHHSLYEGCTLYDLQFICQRCNTQTRNKNLK